MGLSKKEKAVIFDEINTIMTAAIISKECWEVRKNDKKYTKLQQYFLYALAVMKQIPELKEKLGHIMISDTLLESEKLIGRQGTRKLIKEAIKITGSKKRQKQLQKDSEKADKEITDMLKRASKDAIKESASRIRKRYSYKGYSSHISRQVNDILKRKKH